MYNDVPTLRQMKNPESVGEQASEQAFQKDQTLNSIEELKKIDGVEKMWNELEEIIHKAVDIMGGDMATKILSKEAFYFQTINYIEDRLKNENSDKNFKLLNFVLEQIFNTDRTDLTKKQKESIKETVENTIIDIISIINNIIVLAEKST